MKLKSGGVSSVDLDELFVIICEATLHNETYILLATWSYVALLEL